MYDLKEKITFEYRATNGTDTGVCLGDYSNPRADIGGVIISFSDTGNMSPCYFIAAKIPNYDPYSDPLYIYSNGSFNGTPTVVNDSVNNSGFWITENDTSGPFMTFYNAVFGAGKTRQEIFAELKATYGDDYTFFGIIPYFDNYPIPDYYKTAGYYFKDDPEHTKISTIATNSLPGYVIDSDYIDCFDSLQAIDPEILENIMAMAPTDRTVGVGYYFMMSPAPEPEEKLIFDVYVDGVIGEKGPNVQIKWRNANPDTSNLAPALIRPHVWGAGYPGIAEPSGPPTSFLKTVEGVKVPDNDKTPFNTLFEFADEGYTASYVGASDIWYSNVSNIERVLNFGPDMIPIDLVFLLRFDYMQDLGVWGDLWYVYIPYNYEGAAYVEHAPIANSGYGASYATEVNIIGGTPPDDVPDDPDEGEQGYDDDDEESGEGPYPDPDDQPDISDYDSEGYPGEAVLTTTYKLTKARLQDVGSKLWSQSYFDVLKIQSNPIENIIACRWYPMNITGGADESIVIGDVNIGTNGSPIATTYRKVIGTFTYKGVISENGKNLTPGYLAQSPYTTLKLHLPYAGCVQLDASEIFNRELSIEYIVDIVTGDVLVLLKLGSHKMPYMSLSGKMGVDIPISGTDRAQIQIAAATRAVTAVVGAAGQMIEGNAGKAAGAAGGILSMAGMDYPTQRTIQHSSVCASYDNRAIVLEMHVNKAHISEGYTKYHGLPSHQYMSLSKGMGFVQISKRTVIDVAMTDEENRQLEAIMTQGCYF